MIIIKFVVIILLIKLATIIKSLYSGIKFGIMDFIVIVYLYALLLYLLL